MKSVFLSALFLALPFATFAQEPDDNQGRRVVGPPVPQPAARPAPNDPSFARFPGRVQHVEGDALSQNVTITVKGVLQGLVPVDLALTGCGPQFVTDYPAKQAPDAESPAPILAIQVTLRETEEGFRADYSLSARVAVVTSVNRGPDTVRNFEFRDLVLKGAAHMKLDQPVTVSQIDGESLELVVTKTE